MNTVHITGWRGRTENPLTADEWIVRHTTLRCTANFEDKETSLASREIEDTAVNE